MEMLAYIHFMREKSYQKRVLVWDSGVGGLSIVRALVEQKCGLDIVYYADSRHAPYGDKSVEWLRENVLPCIRQKVEKLSPQIIVLACNTLTASVVEDLRHEYGEDFVVGTEPAIKPATKINKAILLLATPTTYDNCKILRSVEKDIELSRILDVNLASMIERYYDEPKVLDEYLEKLLCDYKSTDMAVVLGCTHYVLVRERIQNILGSGVMLLDGTQGVCNRVIRMLGCNNCECSVELIGNKNVCSVWERYKGA